MSELARVGLAQTWQPTVLPPGFTDKVDAITDEDELLEIQRGLEMRGDDQIATLAQTHAMWIYTRWAIGGLNPAHPGGRGNKALPAGNALSSNDRKRRSEERTVHEWHSKVQILQAGEKHASWRTCLKTARARKTESEAPAPDLKLTHDEIEAAKAHTAEIEAAYGRLKAWVLETRDFVARLAADPITIEALEANQDREPDIAKDYRRFVAAIDQETP